MSKLSAAERIDAHVRHILTNPTTEMRNAFRALPDCHRWMLFALLDCERWNREPTRLLQQTYERLCPESAVGPFNRTFTELTEAFLRISDNSVSWIHPTCRDLAISELADSHEHRRHFLRHCSAPGMGVALALGAGAQGDVDLPLVGSPSDWNLIRLRARELDAKDVLELTIGLHGAIQWRWRESGRSFPDELREIGREALEAMIDWVRDSHQLSQRELCLILRGRRLFRPATAIPGVARYVRILVENATGIMESDNMAEVADIIKEFGDFCEALRELEPRLLRASSRTDSFENFTAACRRAATVVVHDRLRDLEDEDEISTDDLETMASRYDRLEDGVRTIRAEFDTIGAGHPALSRLESEIDETKEALEDEVKRRQPPAKKRKPRNSWKSYEDRVNDSADLRRIQTVFRDL